MSRWKYARLCNAWCKDVVEHRSVAKDGQIKPAECHELRRELSDLVEEGLDQLFLQALTNMGCANCLHFPAQRCSSSNDCADADSGVVDQFEKTITNRGSDFFRRFTNEGASSIASKIGNCFQIPYHHVPEFETLVRNDRPDMQGCAGKREGDLSNL
jgi:hypothetical protein